MKCFLNSNMVIKSLCRWCSRSIFSNSRNSVPIWSNAHLSWFYTNLTFCKTSSNEVNTVNYNKGLKFRKSLIGLSEEDKRAMIDFSHGQHAGKTSLNVVELPQTITDTINDLLYADKGLASTIRNEARNLDAFLKSRTTPYTDTKFDKKKWKESMMNRLSELEAELSYEQMEMFQKEIELEADKRQMEMKKISGFWHSIAYDSYHTCLAYTLCRAAPNYAVFVRVLNEILVRDGGGGGDSFKPEFVLDFGSGCGSFVWALLTMWPQCTKHYYLNDVSTEFNKLSCSIIGGDDVDFVATANGIYYKLHLPADVRPNFDLVFCGYALSELNGPSSRIATVRHLLKCTKKYIVFVENGNLRSHHLMEELREYVASNFDNQFEIFAPCPHLKPCPLLMLNMRGNRRKMVCRSEVKYIPFHIRNYPQLAAATESFTYLIFKRKDSAHHTNLGLSCEENKNKKGTATAYDEKWPRIVQKPIVSNRHVTLRLCCPDGNISQSVVTKSKHPWYFYRSCRNSALGDRIPISNLEDEQQEISEEESNEDDICFVQNDFDDNEQPFEGEHQLTHSLSANDICENEDNNK